MKDRRRKKHFSANSDIQVKGPPFPVEAGMSLYVPRLQGTLSKLFVLMVKDWSRLTALLLLSLAWYGDKLMP